MNEESKGIDYKTFCVRYFEPLNSYYLCHELFTCLTKDGSIGRVFYYSSKEEAEAALIKFKEESKTQ